MQNAKYGLVEMLDIVPRCAPSFFLDRSLYLADFSSSQLKTCWGMMMGPEDLSCYSGISQSLSSALEIVPRVLKQPLC
jgi:hypothetical protein